MNFYRSDGWVKLVQGTAVAGAQIFILSQPANVTPPITPPNTIPIPFVPNPQVQVYSDAGFTPVMQPVITDGFGHYDFYALPGLYTVAVFFGGKLQQFYIDQSVGNVGSSLGTSLLLETNGTPNFNQTLQNLVQGAGIVLATDNFGNTTITNTGIATGLTLKTNGTTNGSQSLLNLVNGTSIAITQDGLGNTTVTNTAPVVDSSLFLNTPDTARFAMWESSTVTAFGSVMVVTNDVVTNNNSGNSSTATPHVATATAGITTRLDVVAAGGGQGGISYAGLKWMYPGRNITVKGTVAIGSAGTNTVALGLYAGVSDQAANGPGTPTNGDGIFIACSGTGAALGNWKLVTNTGSSTASVDSGVAIVADTRYTFLITFIAGTATLYINGILRATQSTVGKVPTTVNLGLYWLNFIALNGTSPSCHADFEYLYVSNTTP